MARTTPSDRAASDDHRASAIVESIRAESRIQHIGPPPLPDTAGVAAAMERVRDLVFPGFFSERLDSDADLESQVRTLASDVHARVRDVASDALTYWASHGASERPLPIASSPDELADGLLEAIPNLRAALALDVQAAYDGDPAATHIDETILCYPGVDAIFAHRVAHLLLNLGLPIVPRIIAEQAHSRTGIDIHPAASIGKSFFVDHGAGVVVGETAVIGDNVKIYQGVTLGARSFPKDERGRLIRGQKRHPTVGNRVTIYAGAVILGGDTVIGDDCVVSGGVFLSQSVPARHVVRQKQPELVMRTNREAAPPA